MVRKLIFTLGVVLLCADFYAQGEMQNINEIKKQTETYLYAESTSVTWQDALDNAKLLLGVEIESWAKQQNEPADTYVAEAQKHIYEIKSMRGDRYRAFVYVKKTDVFSLSNNSSANLVANKDNEQPANSDINKKLEEDFSTLNLTPWHNDTSVYEATEFEQEIMSISDANNIGMYIKRLKEDGRVNQYGKYKDMPQNTNCYLFVYNRDLVIVAHLHKQGLEYINIKTGEPDYMTNYKGCGAWWFQLK